MTPCVVSYLEVILLVAEETLVETGETASVTGLILGHFVNSVVDGVEVGFLGVGGDTHLVGIRAGLGMHTLLKVGLGVPYAVAEEFGELGGMFGFLPSVTLEGLCDFGISLAVGLTRHGEIHADLGAFTHEVGVEVFDHLFVETFGDTDFMLGDELETSLGAHFLELAAGSATEGALFGSLITFVDITTYGADKFLFHSEY